MVVGHTDALDDGVSLAIGVGSAPAALVAVDVQRGADDEGGRKFDVGQLLLVPRGRQVVLDIVFCDERSPNLSLTLLGCFR